MKKDGPFAVKLLLVVSIGISVLFAAGLLFISGIAIVRSIQDKAEAKNNHETLASPSAVAEITEKPRNHHPSLWYSLSDLEYDYDRSTSISEILDDMPDSEIFDYLLNRYGQSGTTVDGYSFSFSEINTESVE